MGNHLDLLETPCSHLTASIVPMIFFTKPTHHLGVESLTMGGLERSMCHAVILCSRGRPRELEVAVRNLCFQNLSPKIIIIVVTSQEDLSENIDSLKETLLEKEILLEIFVSAPGLTKQRNFGLSKVNGDIDIVHFFDDDVILPPEYLDIVDSLFQSRLDISGIGGRTTDNTDIKVSSLERFFLLNSKSSGVLLPSGINVGFRYSVDPYEVDWLPGCTMSYRISRIHGISFDESREGVGWGEDVDFSARVAERGKLLMFSHPRILHTKSTVYRVNDLERSLKNDNSRIKLARNNVGGVKICWILWSFFGEIVVGSKILRLYFTSLLDLIKQSLISIARLFRIMYEFTEKFWRNVLFNLKYLNVFTMRKSFRKITQYILTEARVLGLRSINFYKQLKSSEIPAK